MVHHGMHQEALSIDENVPLLAFDLFARIVTGQVRDPPFSALFVTASVVWGLREAKPADKCLGIGGQGFDDLPALLLGGRDKRADGREVLSPLIRAEAA